MTRYDRNAAPANPMAAGDDVLIIDPARRHIARPHRSRLVRAAGDRRVRLQARPDRAIIAAGKVVVTLNNLNDTFSIYGAGGVVVIDPATDTVVQHLPLGGPQELRRAGLRPGDEDGAGRVRRVVRLDGAGAGVGRRGGRHGHDAGHADAHDLGRRFRHAAGRRSCGCCRCRRRPARTRAFASTMGSFSPEHRQIRCTASTSSRGGTIPFGTATPFDLGTPGGRATAAC